MSGARPAEGAIASMIRASTLEPRVALVLGSGLGDVAARIDVAARANLDDVLGLRVPAVAGHAREVIVGRLGPQPIVALVGRYHLYQGLTASEVAAPIRALAGTSIRTVVLTNAAGGINSDFRVGDLMLIRDHINLPGLAGHSPLVPPLDGGAVSFVPMRDAYSAALRELAMRAGHDAGLPVRDGVYAMVAGPSYETAAELCMLRALGADAVGMSTVPEVVMARAIGLDVLAISLITNRAVPEEDAVPSHDEVLREGQRGAQALARLIDRLLPHIA